MSWRFPTPSRRVKSDWPLCEMHKDIHDERDHLVQVVGLSLPKRSHFAEHLPEVKQQGEIGSCMSHALCSAMETLASLHGAYIEMPLSELWHYWRVRQKDYQRTFPADTGQTARMGLKVAHQLGVPPEPLWPYDTRFYNAKPTLLASSFARFWKLNGYKRCMGVQDIRKALHLKKPVLVGLKIRYSFITNRDGKIVDKTDRFAGGHEVMFYGYDDTKKEFMLLNSWGTAWGKNGKARIPYDFVEKYLIDAWAVE